LKWYVQEGDFVKNTILFISEIKEDYMDPNLVQNTKNQLDAKSQVEFYSSKYGAFSQPNRIYTKRESLKLEQAENKLKQARFK
jgi:hypothetical protein